MLLKKTYYHVSEILKEIFTWKITFRCRFIQVFDLEKFISAMIKQGKVTTMVTYALNEVERYVVTDRMKLEIIFSSYYYIILQ